MTTIPAHDNGSKSFAAKNQKVFVKPHCKVSIEDINWVRKQPPCVQQLWLDCIAAEQFGGAPHDLETEVCYNSLQRAKTALAERGLFEFEPKFQKPVGGRSRVVGFRVKNLHGYYNKHYWESPSAVNFQNLNTEAQENEPEVHSVNPEFQEMKLNEPQTPTQQEVENTNNVLTTSQQPTKVVGEGVKDSTPAAPCGGSVVELNTEEIFQYLDEASRGICPPKDAIAQILNTPYNATIRSAIARNPQWGIKISGNAIVEDAVSIPENSMLREDRKRSLKSYSLLKECPPIEFLKACWSDPPLRIIIKQLFGHHAELFSSKNLREIGNPAALALGGKSTRLF